MSLVVQLLREIIESDHHYRYVQYNVKSPYTKVAIFLDAKSICK